jgi:hypothetical protein
VIFEKGKVGKDDNLEHGIWVQMDNLDFVMIEQTTEEIASRMPKSPLEESLRNHNFIDVGSWDFFILGWPPLKNGTGRKKVVIDQLKVLTLIDGGVL